MANRIEFPSGTKPYNRTTMPDMSGYKAFLLDGAFYGAVAALLAECGMERAANIADADVVVFIGGADINPKLYGEEAHASTSFSQNRDLIEVAAYELARKHNKPMFGICRGAQLLHALNGGKLWQDVNGHAGATHIIVDLEEDVTVDATSVHHQMLKFNDKMNLIAVTQEQVATRFQDADSGLMIPMGTADEDSPLEIEAGAYMETGCFFVQGHPEIGSREYKSWTMNKLWEFIIEWENITDDPSFTLTKPTEVQTDIPVAPV